MNVLIRKTIAGTEYWDTEKKQSLFVPKGSEPDFEVIENPNSIITPEGDKVIIAYDESDRKDKTVVSEMIQHKDGAIDVQDITIVENSVKDEEPSELENMSIKDLRAYAKRNGITIPAAVRAKGDIVEIIKESEK
ncbi:Rho termination factor N-terminal domain-containing protein [Enterococcus sp. HY326]|uniref:Rho termination factor N-terminal domain-containing protein n=1 Tax=Enterococcus sp. HY326 TaxID=2971265 RepID=UPI0022406964|nr:Rho termination factor N-terminal domain-containing protein [Enterococcus sp. HY326]